MRWRGGLVCGVEGEGETGEEGEGAGEEEGGEGVVRGSICRWERGDFPGAVDAAVVEDELDAIIQICFLGGYHHLFGRG